MLQFTVNQLKAALLHSAKKDNRYYLNGVNVEAKSGESFIVSTTGHTLFAGKTMQAESREDFNIIIPRETVELAIKGKKGLVYLIKINDDTWNLGDILFRPIDGVFPDWRRVTPREISNEIGQFNHEYLGRASESLRLWDDVKTDYTPLQHNGLNPALMATDSAYVVIMPMRRDNPIVPAFIG